MKAVLDEEIGNVGKNKSVKIIGDVVLTGTSSGNYDLNNDFNRTSTVNIIPVPAEFVWSEKTKFNYDGNIHAVTAVVKNKKSENDVFNLKYDNNKEGNSGDYLARVIALGNEKDGQLKMYLMVQAEAEVHPEVHQVRQTALSKL